MKFIKRKLVTKKTRTKSTTKKSTSKVPRLKRGDKTPKPTKEFLPVSSTLRKKLTTKCRSGIYKFNEQEHVSNLRIVEYLLEEHKLLNIIAAGLNEDDYNPDHEFKLIEYSQSIEGITLSFKIQFGGFLDIKIVFKANAIRRYRITVFSHLCENGHHYKIDKTFDCPKTKYYPDDNEDDISSK